MHMRARLSGRASFSTLGSIIVSPDQCREARAILKWTRHELAVTADVPLWFIAAYEDGKDTAAFLAHYEIAMRQALEAVGIGFVFEVENGEIKSAGVTYSPRGKDEVN
jgi:hypothetical protein